MTDRRDTYSEERNFAVTIHQLVSSKQSPSSRAESVHLLMSNEDLVQAHGSSRSTRMVTIIRNIAIAVRRNFPSLAKHMDEHWTRYRLVVLHDDDKNVQLEEIVLHGTLVCDNINLNRLSKKCALYMIAFDDDTSFECDPALLSLTAHPRFPIRVSVVDDPYAYRARERNPCKTFESAQVKCFSFMYEVGAGIQSNVLRAVKILQEVYKVHESLLEQEILHQFHFYSTFPMDHDHGEPTMLLDDALVVALLYNPQMSRFCKLILSRFGHGVDSNQINTAAVVVKPSPSRPESS